MDPLEKEARIRLYMEKLRKEEEEAKKARISQEKKFLEDETQKQLQQEIFKSSKNRIALEKVEACIKSNDWVGVIEQLNECLFECGYKRLVETYDDYTKMNKRAGDIIKNDIENPYDFNDKKEYIRKISLIEYGLTGGVHDKEKYSYRFDENRMPGLKSFVNAIERFSTFSYLNFFYYEVFYFVRNYIINILKKYDPSGFYC